MRLTEERKENTENCKYMPNSNWGIEDQFKVLCKLGKLEDIEERNNCPFEVLEQIRKTWKIYSQHYHDYIDIVSIVLYEEMTRPYFVSYYKNKKTKLIFVDDYKETWWLTKEEKENG